MALPYLSWNVPSWSSSAAAEDSFNERTDRDHASFAEEYIRYILEADAAPGIEFEYALVRAYVPEISLDDITDFASELAAIDERAVLVIAPEKEDLDLPDEAELAAILEGVASKEIDPYEDQLVSAELIPVLPAPAAIVHEESWDEIGVSMIELENGVRVLMKPTEFSNDEVIFTAVSPGGSSQVDDDAYPEASMSFCRLESGLGERQLQRSAAFLACRQNRDCHAGHTDIDRRLRRLSRHPGSRGALSAAPSLLCRPERR